MSTESRLKRLGLYHLKDKPEELQKALGKGHREHQERIKKFRQNQQNPMKSSTTNSKCSLFQTLAKKAMEKANATETGEPPIKMPKQLALDFPTSMTKQPWLPKELKPFRKARALLGVLIDPPRLGLEKYHHRHDEKMLMTISNTKHPRDLILEVTSRPDMVEMLPDRTAPAILEWMKLDPRLLPARTSMALFLRKKLPIDQIVQELELDREERAPVNEKRFEEEIRTATLEDYLELAIPI